MDNELAKLTKDRANENRKNVNNSRMEHERQIAEASMQPKLNGVTPGANPIREKNNTEIGSLVCTIDQENCNDEFLAQIGNCSKCVRI